MKISQMTTGQATDVLCKITPPMTRLLADERAIPMIQNVLDAGKSDKAMEAITAVLMKVVPYLLKDHKEDIFEIIGGLNGKTAAQIDKQNVLKTMQMVKDSVDQELIDFFKSSGTQTNTGVAG